MSETAPQPRINRAKLVDWSMMIVIVGLLGWAAFSTMQPSPLEQLVGQSAPKFKLKTQSGEVTGPGEFEGKVVLLEFWATWCKPCLDQMPVIEKFSEEAGDNLVVLTINVDEATPDRAGAMDQFLEKARVDVDSLVDDGSVAAMYGVETIPALVLIGPDGVVRWASSGVHSAKVLLQRMDELEGGT